jgi:hypothetical protein
MAILNTYSEHNVAVTVADQFFPVIRFLSHTAALPFLEEEMFLAFLLDLYLYFPDIPRKYGLILLYSELKYCGRHMYIQDFSTNKHVNPSKRPPVNLSYLVFPKRRVM